MEDTEASPGIRQTLLSFYSMNRTFVKIVFTQEQRVHDPELVDEPKEVYINALVLLSVTNRYDCEIYSKMHEKEDIEVTMPFGSAKTFQDIVQWLVYAQEPEDFVAYQLCAEFARFYGISLPDHPDSEIVHDKLDDMDFPPPAGEPLEVQNDWKDIYEEVVQWEGRLYKRRSFKKHQHGCYYYCMNVLDGTKCKGSIFVSETGEIRAIKEHNQECRDSHLAELDLTCWDKVEQELMAIAHSSPDRSSWHVLTTLLEKDEALAHCVLQLPLHVVLRYITSLFTKQGTESLDERMEAYANLAQGSILYHEVYPENWLVYSHPQLKDRVKDVRWLLIDGTFKACPTRFGQLLTLLSRDETTGVFFPVVHALMPSRTTKSYLRLFEIIDNYFSFPRLSYVTVDFEKSLVQAVQSWVEGRDKPVEIIGCKFHYAKAVTHHFKGRKRRRLTAQESAILKAFQSMPYLERRDIEKILRGFETVVHSHGEFTAYFRRTWMSDLYFPLWNLSNKQHRGLRTRYTNNGIESFHSRIGSELSRHPQTQNLLRWLEDYSEEKLREIQTTSEVGHEVDTGTELDRLEILFEWRKILESFETRPEFCVLPFSFVCPTCGAVNELQGRRQSHLICQANCGHDLDGPYTEKVVDQTRHSLEASFERAMQEDEALAVCTMKRLRCWFRTLDDNTLQTQDAIYIRQMKHFIKSLIPGRTLTQTVMHLPVREPVDLREDKRPGERITRGRPNRIARIVIPAGHAVYLEQVNAESRTAPDKAPPS